MAIKIKTLDPAAVQTTNGTVMNDSNTVIILDEGTRTFSGPSGYVVAVAGDSNSQILTFKVPAEVDGVDLSGTITNIEYYSNWTDSQSNHSWGVIDVSDTIQSISEEGVITYYLFSWLLDLRQTAFPGSVKFDLKFSLVLEDGNSYYVPSSIIVNTTEYPIYLDELDVPCYYIPNDALFPDHEYYYTAAGATKNPIAHPLHYVGSDLVDSKGVIYQGVSSYGHKVTYYENYTYQTKQGMFSVVDNLGLEGYSEPIGNTGFETLLNLIAANRADFIELKEKTESMVPITVTRAAYETMVTNNTYILERTYDIIEEV